MWREKSGENGLITTVTFHSQPRGRTVGLRDSPSLPPLPPSAVSRLQVLGPTGHRGKSATVDLAQDDRKLREENKGEG